MPFSSTSRGWPGFDSTASCDALGHNVTLNVTRRGTLRHAAAQLNPVAAPRRLARRVHHGKCLYGILPHGIVPTLKPQREVTT